MKSGATTNARELRREHGKRAATSASSTSYGPTASKVTQLKTSGDGAPGVVMVDVGGFRIVGARVSTCAPLIPPK